MINRFLRTLLLIFLLLVGFGISLIPLLLVQPHLPVQPFATALMTWAVIYLLPLPIILRMIIRKAWFYRGKGEAVTREMLKLRLMGISELNSPVVAEKKGEKIKLSWRCHDLEWCERMVVQGLSKQYELFLQFDADTRTVIMSDRIRTLNLDLCPIKVKIGFLASPRFYCRVQTGDEWGLKLLEQTGADGYRFIPQELKSPVFNAIIDNGWNVRFDYYY